MSKATIAFDASKLDLFTMCEARYNYRYNLKRNLPQIAKSKNLDYGTLIHIALESYYSALAEGQHYNDRVQLAINALQAAAADPESSNVDDPKELNLLLSTVEQNLDFWRFEDETLEILAVEAPFDYVLYEDDTLRIIFSGKIDLLVNKPALGGSAEYTNLPFDHKSFSRDSIVPRLDNQFLNYVNVTNSNYLIVNRIGLQKTLTPEQKFKRLPLSYDHLIKEDWKQNTIKIILNNYLNCVTEDEWVMRFRSCRAFNRLCEYFEVCDSSGAEAKAFKLEANYEEGKPWDKYGNKE